MTKILNGHFNYKLIAFHRAYNRNMQSSGFFRFLQGAALFATATLLAACLSGGGGGDPATTTAAPPAAPPIVVLPPGAAVACLPDASADYLVANYYVDAAIGLDGNNGLTPGTAWQTLARALAAPAPAVIHVKAGSYGVLTETTPVARGGYLTIRPDPLAAPGSVILTGINIQYAGPAKSPTRLRVIGFTIKPDYDPNNNAIVRFKNTTELELHNNTISTIKYAKASATPGNPSMFDGVGLVDTDAILIKSNKITGVFRGIQLGGSSNTAMKCNYISTENGSAIQYLSGNSNALIEDNHIRGGANVLFPGDPDAPDSVNAHASIVSIRSESVTIRNNIMHGMGTTSGIRFYVPDVTGGLPAYSNITIEGNAIYDTDSEPLQLVNAANNIIVKNNVIVSRYRKWTPPSTLCADGNTPDARFRYESAISVSPAAGFTGSGVSLINNIFVGAAFFPAAVNERNNIIWSYSPDGTFPATTPSGTSMVITSSFLGCGNHSTFFETGFFAAAPNFEPNHGLVINYKPAPASAAVNFGNESLQLQRALGILDASDVFVSTIVGRAPGQRSAGPYEP
jgi:hypothetical protein